MSSGSERSHSERVERSTAQNSESHYRAIVESQAEMVCRFQPDGTILFVNNAYAQARGVTAAELTKANFWEFIDESDRPGVRQQLDQLSPSSPEIRIENRFETADGIRWTLWTNRGLVFDAQGQALEVQSTGIDITERKLAEEQLRASQERQRIATNAAGLGVFEWNRPDDYAVWENERIYEIFGHSLDEGPFHERDFYQSYLHPADRDVFEQAFADALRPGNSLNLVCRVQRKSDGAWRWVSIDGNFTFADDGTPVRLVGVIADVTARKEAEAALRQMNETLEDRVIERTAQVRALAAQLTIAEQEERRRIAQILHDDLQQHIFGAQFQLQALHNALTVGDLEQALERIQDIDATLKTSIRVTRRLNMDLNPPILSASGLVEIIRWLALEMQHMHGLIVHVQAVGEVTLPDADLRILLLQVIRELLFNVVKHAGVAEVEVTLVRVDGWIRIEVRDQGCGFDVTDIAGENVHSHGLWQTRQRLELMGGRMAIESQPGCGVRVVVDCPMQRDAV